MPDGQIFKVEASSSLSLGPADPEVSRPRTVVFLYMRCTQFVPKYFVFVFSEKHGPVVDFALAWLRMCNGVAVMRRRSDSWLNATQILKVANFDKPQRTRILEREVQKGEHEKVQGGYGKYQGTVPSHWALEHVGLTWSQVPGFP